jgi:transcriptional regulator with XRE-family HTH domain
MRAARALLGLSIIDAAPRIGVSPRTINLIEKGETVRASSAAKIVEGLDRLGVEILGGKGTGAFLRQAPVA